MHKLMRILALFFAVAVCYVLYISYAIYAYGNVDEKTNADAAIVLGAAAWGEKPSPVFRERINHAIWLYKNGYVDKLIFTGGKTGEGDLSEAGVAKDYAIDNAVPAEDIYIEEQSTVTEENIMNAARIVKEHGIHSVIIVSDPLHMKRAMLMAKDYGLNATSSPTPTTMYRTLKTKLPFLAREVYMYIGYQVVGFFEDFLCPRNAEGVCAWNLPSNGSSMAMSRCSF